ncbi:hypothetical protein AB2B38_009390 [Balneola sp. MJW-20]|uniref:hypothetical protein n=1 Tax=Gracilimonas aurantiaca TaxID=3234185 RepID=UPI0034662644
MKLLIILSIEEHTDIVRKILADEGVPMYSETDIYGFKTDRHQPDLSNWFAHENDGTFSKLFFSIQTEEAVDNVLQSVKNYNAQHEDSKNYPLHAYQLNIEKHV